MTIELNKKDKAEKSVSVEVGSDMGETSIELADFNANSQDGQASNLEMSVELSEESTLLSNDVAPLKAPEEPVLIFTEGPAPIDTKKTGGFSPWLFSFLGAIIVLTGLCIYRPDPYLTILKFLPDGLLITFQITIISVAIAIPIGLLTGLGRLSKNPIINGVASVYVEVIRGIPLMMQLFYIYYALALFVKISPMFSAVISLSFCYGAYMGEVFRAGILSISHGQTEAARSLGFNQFQTMYYIILPQAMRTILPPIGNECIALLKDTSLVSVIAVADVLRRAREYASLTYEYFEAYTTIALVYLIITLLLSKMLNILERRLSAYDRSR